MPTYDFRCKACGREFEVTSSFAERDERAVCPACGSHKVQTVIKTFSIGSLHKSGADQTRSRLASGALVGAGKT